MDIQNDKSDKLNIAPISSIASQLEEIEVDLSSKPNVFSRAVPQSFKSHNISNPIKRLNIYDSDFMPQEEAGIQANTKKNPADLNQKLSFNQMAVAFRGLIAKTPVLNYFILSDKRNRLKETLDKLNSINSEVNELTSLKSPYGERDDKYSMLCSNLAKANQIHSQIIKEIQD